MTLTIHRGSRKDIIRTLLQEATDRPPSLIVDCANCADPHTLFPFIPMETFASVHVIIAEAIYRFRDSLKQVPEFAQQLGTRTIIITPFDRLFDYGNTQETEDVINHAWELMQQLAQEYTVITGVAD
ncbi:MAG: hypothetical protein ACOCWQ_05515 [Nanoarchaeota archaeon]